MSNPSGRVSFTDVQRAMTSPSPPLHQKSNSCCVTGTLMLFSSGQNRILLLLRLQEEINLMASSDEASMYR